MPPTRQTPALIQLADEFDLFYTDVCRLVRPLAPQVDPHQWQTIQTQAQDYQRKLEAMADAASIAQSLLTTGLPRSRHARAYRKLAAAVRS